MTPQTGGWHGSAPAFNLDWWLPSAHNNHPLERQLLAPAAPVTRYPNLATAEVTPPKSSTSAVATYLGSPP